MKSDPHSSSQFDYMAGAVPSDQALALEKRSNAELETAFLRGVTPAVEDLIGWEFRGINTPAWARIAGIKKFIKGFFRNEAGVAMGYNCPVEQNALNERWIAKPNDLSPKRFGYYTVGPVDPTSRDNKYLHALLLDYGKGGNKPWDPTAGLRDYVVQLDPSSIDLYICKAYYAIGPARLESNYFMLERHRRGLGEMVSR